MARLIGHRDRVPGGSERSILVGVATDVFDWIETWYNRRRSHTALGMISPLEYESQHYEGVRVTNP